MNLKQLHALCEIIDRGLSISNASHSLYRTQPSITRQIQELEHELGIELFVRRRNRLLDVTPQGRPIVEIARRMLEDAKSIQRLSDEFLEIEAGDFSIATTHTQARYVLPRVIHSFLKKFPRVRLTLHQGTPTQCHHLVAQGKADIGICTETRELPEEVVVLPCYGLRRNVVTLPGNPLLRAKTLTLAKIAEYPIITYDDGFSARSIIEQAFAANGLKPNVVLSAIDADVSKAYVEMGMGIAILAKIAFDPKKDINLRSIDANKLFPPSTLGIVVRRNNYLRGYMVEFMREFAPSLKRMDVRGVLSGDGHLPSRSGLPPI